MAEIDVKFMKGNRELAKAMGHKIDFNKSKKAAPKNTKQKGKKK